MELHGWGYTGRNIGPDLHRQYKTMIDCLADPGFVNHSQWGTQIQEKIADVLKVKSGTVRTIKKVCSNFGLLNSYSFNSHNEIDSGKLLTKRGQIVYQAAALELLIDQSSEMDDKKKEAVIKEINTLYEQAYCEALMYYRLTNSDGTSFHPLRATLIALEKYGRLDKWEWYLLNTVIRHDDNSEEQAELDRQIKKYREGEYSFTMHDVVENPKGHQYTPQYFEFAGLLHVIQRPEWSISDSGRNAAVKEKVMSADYNSFLQEVNDGQ